MNAPGKTSPRSTTRIVWTAIEEVESSGITLTAAKAAAAEAAAPPKYVAGGVLTAVPTSGNKPGARDTAVEIRGRTLSALASATPNASSSSANIKSGLTEESLNPAASNLDNNPSCAV